MSEGFKIEIINPEKSFLLKENVSEVVVPAYEGEMGILKDHIPIISFLKPGILKVFIGSEVENFYVEDGIAEFNDNTLSILTSHILDIKNVNKDAIKNFIIDTEKELSKENIKDQKHFLLNHKLEVLKSININ